MIDCCGKLHDFLDFHINYVEKLPEMSFLVNVILMLRWFPIKRETFSLRHILISLCTRMQNCGSRRFGGEKRFFSFASGTAQKNMGKDQMCQEQTQKIK